MFDYYSKSIFYMTLCDTDVYRYTGWKGMLDADLLREPAVKHHLNQALDMMNRAVAGTFQPGARENMAYLISTERRYNSILSN